MSELQFRSDMGVELIDSLGDDYSILMAARVSTGKDAPWGQNRDNLSTADKGLINFLMRDRHGSPFEAVVYKFVIECPIFVAREFFRHRIASYNEVSARYVEVQPVFYVPGMERPLTQVGKPGGYTFEAGSYNQSVSVAAAHRRIAEECWTTYKGLLLQNVAREVARNVLPVSLYTRFVVTMNLRSLMNFLSLRWAHEESATPTFPLYEIQEVAKQMDSFAKQIAPVAFEAFTRSGRVAP